jgi:hypothetical protein
MPKSKLYILQTVSDLYCLAGEVFSKSFAKNEKEEEITVLKAKLSQLEEEIASKEKNYNSSIETLRSNLLEKEEQNFREKQSSINEEKEKYQILFNNFNEELQKKNEKERKDLLYLQETNKKLMEYETQLTKLSQENYQLKMEILSLTSMLEKSDSKGANIISEEMKREV